jgi:predicted RNase H-like nuclease (RuvC/YqgF family)
METDKAELAEQLAQIPAMQTAIAEYTEESKEMLKTIDRLEQENSQLVTQVEASSSESQASSSESEELAKLKQQYAELEARYLELRMQG